jgi:hypothetical protein
MINLMNGAHEAKSYVNQYLSTDIPLRLITYRNGWNADSTQLPDPEQYITHEPLAIDAWPSVVTLVLSTNQLTRIGFERENPVYRVSYSMRTYVWVRTEGPQECGLMRDRMITVIRSSLLDYPCLKAYDSRANFRILIDEGTIREEFSDTTLLKGERYMAGAFLAYTLEIDEVVERLDIGEVAEIDVTVRMPELFNDQPVEFDFTV